MLWSMYLCLHLSMAIHQEVDRNENANIQFCVWIFLNKKMTECGSHSLKFVLIVRVTLLPLYQSDLKMPHTVQISNLWFKFFTVEKKFEKCHPRLHLFIFCLCCYRGFCRVTSIRTISGNFGFIVFHYILGF